MAWVEGRNTASALVPTPPAHVPQALSCGCMRCRQLPGPQGGHVLVMVELPQSGSPNDRMGRTPCQLVDLLRPVYKPDINHVVFVLLCILGSIFFIVVSPPPARRCLLLWFTIQCPSVVCYIMPFCGL